MSIGTIRELLPLHLSARGDVRVPASPYHLDGRALGPRSPAPYRVGEHTRSVLESLLGYAPARVSELARAGFVESP